MQELIEQYRLGQISRQQLEEGLKTYWDSLETPDAQFAGHRKEEMWLVIMQSQPMIIRSNKIVWWKYAAAAVVIGLMIFTGKQFFKEKQPVTVAKIINVPAPASNRATLTLANGKTVYLDSATNGQLAMQDQVKLVKLADGKIAYSGTATELQYNTLTNPKGSKAINIELPDHSQIWLNAGSSVTYPIAFVGKERKVTMTGELYYEVFHNEHQPFTVTKGNTSVTVLGTHFNVKAYDNDPDVKVTLLEGVVRLTRNAESLTLKPNQQAIVANQMQLIENADTEQAVAWKNGMTSFHSADIQTVLRELERWYDITTEVKGNLKTKNFFAEAPRTAPLKDVLQSIFDDNNIAYEYDREKRKLTILQ